MTAARRVDVRVPELGTARATFSYWYVVSGERVFAGDRLAEILIPGAVVDVSAPATGLFERASAAVHDSLAPGQIIGTLLCEAESGGDCPDE